jgi:hypothetical protein
MVYSWSFAPQRRNRPGEREGCVVCGVSTTLGLSQNILTIFAVSQPSKPTPTTQPGMELGSCHLMVSKVSCPNESKLIPIIEPTPTPDSDLYPPSIYVSHR